MQYYHNIILKRDRVDKTRDVDS